MDLRPLNTDVLEKFMGRVRAASQARSKDVRLTMEEAQEMVAAVGQLLARNAALLEGMMNRPEETITITMDGGRLG